MLKKSLLLLLVFVFSICIVSFAQDNKGVPDPLLLVDLPE